MPSDFNTAMSLTVEKKIVMNEMQQPVAVQVDYQDWLKIEQLLNFRSPQLATDFFAHHVPLQSFLTVDPTEYVDSLR